MTKKHEATKRKPTEMVNEQTAALSPKQRTDDGNVLLLWKEESSAWMLQSSSLLVRYWRAS